MNTNTQYLAQKCAGLGLSMYYQSVVGDNEERMTQAFSQAFERSDILILTGGLGPTEDDLTKEVCAKVMGLPLYPDEHSRERIQSYFVRTGRKQITEHCGIVLEAGDEVLTTIEGNTDPNNDANGGCVMKRTRKIGSVTGACRPLYNMN